MSLVEPFAMHLLLVRHGQSKNNILEASHGVAMSERANLIAPSKAMTLQAEHGAGKDFNSKRCVDPPLSDLGKLQALFFSFTLLPFL